MNGWGLHDYLDQPGNTSASSFVNGPGTPPLGSGSLHFSVTTGDDVNRATTNAYDGIQVSTLTALSYDTYQSGAVREQDPYLRLYVNWDGSSSSQDDAWYFEPTYTNSLYGVTGITNQAIVANQWQHWDTMTGAWYSEIADGWIRPRLERDHIREPTCLASQRHDRPPRRRIRRRAAQRRGRSAGLEQL